MDVFESEGHNSTLERIAKRAGVSVGTLYNRFGGTDGLLNAVALDIAKKRLQFNVELARNESDPWSRFEVFVEGVCEFQSADPACSDEVSRHYVDVARLLAVEDTVLDIGDELLRGAQTEGSLRSDVSRDDLLRLLWCHGSLARESIGGVEGRRRSLDFAFSGVRLKPDPLRSDGPR